jgi:SnoaL-like domain
MSGSPCRKLARGRSDLILRESLYVIEEEPFPTDRGIDVGWRHWSCRRMFTEDFKLHDPSIGGFRFGHDGARDMLRSLAEHVPCARIAVLDTVKEGNKVAVR